MCAVSGRESDVEQIAIWIEEQFRTRIQDLIDKAVFDHVPHGRPLHADWHRYLRIQSLMNNEGHCGTIYSSSENERDWGVPQSNVLGNSPTVGLLW